MLPFELVATATASPKYSPAGSLRKFGTEVKGISAAPVTVAFCWADAEPARSRTAAHVEKRCRVMDGRLYQGSRPFNRILRVSECARASALRVCQIAGSRGKTRILADRGLRLRRRSAARRAASAPPCARIPAVYRDERLLAWHRAPI